MPTKQIDQILAAYHATSGKDLDLSCYEMTDQNWATLLEVANDLHQVVSLRVVLKVVPTSVIVQFACCLPNLRHLYAESVNDADLILISEKLSALTTLNMTQTQKVTDVGVDAIANRLTNLTSLYLERAQITDVGVDAIANRLSKLSILDLWGEQVTDVGLKAIADRLTNLNSLTLWAEKVTVNGLKAIADRLTNLCRLSLWSELTDDVMKAIADKLTNLSSLTVWGGQVTDAGVKAIAERLSNLSTLFLGGTLVTDDGVKAIADKLTNLTSLTLWGGQVTDAGVKVIAEQLASLTNLVLTHTQVTDDGVKVIAEQLINLTSLDLSGTKFTDVGVKKIATQLTSLTNLDLTNTQVTDVGVKAIAERLTSLTKLHLTNTQVTDDGVKAVAERLTNLTTLHLSGTKVADAGVKVIAERLTNLTTLHLSGTKVADAGVKAIADRLTNLNSLDLSSTKVADAGVKAIADRLTNLTLLHVEGCKNLTIPKEFVRDFVKVSAIRDYFARLSKEEKRTLNEAKLILVGNEAVGKTSLVNYLIRNTPCTETAKTPGVAIEEGVDVQSWYMEKHITGKTPLKLNVWDFGGQQVLAETHQFFLTARSLYLIVLSARKENENEQETNLVAWLRSIRSRTIEEVPVIVVINKSEGDQQLKIDEARLQREHPAIKRFLRTSCEKKYYGCGIAELRKSIVEVIRTELPHVRDQFPASYFQVKEQLAITARRSSILTRETYRKKCRSAGVHERAEQENLLTLLDRIGIVVTLNDTTLLDPNWLTAAVYRILTHPDVGQANGEFVADQLGKLLTGLNPSDYKPERWPFIIEMMERFGLAFRLPLTAKTYLVPNRSDVAEPNLPGWAEKGLLRFRYEYHQTPNRGLLPRFVVLAHQHLTNPRILWLNGVVLAIQECEVLVKVQQHDRRIGITVRGPEANRRSALAIAREHFAKVHDLNNLQVGTDVYLKVPVEVPECPDAAFDFEFLCSLESDGVKQVTFPGSNSRFEINRLLAGIGPEPHRFSDKEEELLAARDSGGTNFKIHGPVTINHQPQEGDVNNITVNNSGTMAGSAIGKSARTQAKNIINSGNHNEDPFGKRPPIKPWWSALVGPIVAAIVVSVLAAMYLFGANQKVAVLLLIASVAFAVVYIVQTRYAWRSANWPKILIYICVSTAAATAMLPSLKVFLNFTDLVKLQFFIDQSPLVCLFFLVASVALAVIQVYRERHHLHEHG
ncbi:MAG: COR domain-containing protein [Zavarzinella sp.]